MELKSIYHKPRPKMRMLSHPHPYIYVHIHEHISYVCMLTATPPHRLRQLCSFCGCCPRPFAEIMESSRSSPGSLCHSRHRILMEAG